MKQKTMEEFMEYREDENESMSSELVSLVNKVDGFVTKIVVEDTGKNFRVTINYEETDK